MLRLSNITDMTRAIAAAGALCTAIGGAGAQSPEPHETRVLIEAGDVVLGASLHQPQDVAQPSPLIVIVHGSAPTDRDGVGFYTHTALQMGFSVLSFDKRGVGESTGEFIPFSVERSAEAFNDLANDVVHAVDWATRQPGIDMDRIGLFGGSQAGWIMPLAASRHPKVSFIIIGEGAAVSAGEEDAHGHEIRRRRGSERSLDITAADIASADAALRAFTGPHGYDPAPILQTLQVPTLWIFGLKDAVIPVIPSLDRLEAVIRDGRTNNDIIVFPYGDHNFTNVATGERYDLATPVSTWLVDIGVLDE